jgi:hypothetical protein
MPLVVQYDPKILTKFTYMEDTLMKRNYIHEHIKTVLNPANASYHSACPLVRHYNMKMILALYMG